MAAYPITSVDVVEEDGRNVFVIGHTSGEVRFDGTADASYESTDDPMLRPFDRSAAIYPDGTLELLPGPGGPWLLVRRITERSVLLTGDDAADAAEVSELRRNNPGLLVLTSDDPDAAAKLGAPLRATRIRPCR